MSNEVLSICIPTFNRKDILQINLERLISFFEKNEIKNVNIMISDNASTDGTLDLLQYCCSKYEYISFSRNETNIGFDRNYEKAASMSTGKYTLILGDDDTLGERFAMVYDYLNHEEEKIDFIILGNQKSYDNRIFDSKSEIIKTLYLESSWISSMIMNSENIKHFNFSIYYNTYFIQLGVIYQFVAYNECKFKYIYNKDCVYSLRPLYSTYDDSYMNIFVRKWLNLTMSLPNEFSIEEKFYVTKKAEFLKLPIILSLKAKGEFSFDIWERNAIIFKFFTTPNMMILFLICIIPKILLEKSRKIYLNYINRKEDNDAVH